MDEIKRLIRFYERRRWNWIPVVEYLCWKKRAEYVGERRG